MAHTDATYPWADRHTSGTLHYKNLYSSSFGYTTYQKKIAAGTATAVLAATGANTTVKTVTSGITQPDVPRALSVTPGGTTANVLDSVVTVYGTNVEGKPINEVFRFAATASTVTNGVKAFKTVTSVVFDGQAAGGGVTFSVGTRNVIGLRHRLFRNSTTVKVYSATTAYGALTLQGAPTITANESQIELNTYAPVTAPDSTTFHVTCYAFDNWALAPVNDQPEYSTTTSTSSTSSSTSTTTITTSTSSTSSSTSSTSESTSSTSISTSSTSTSTTTTP